MTWTMRSDWVNVQNPSAFPGMTGFTGATGNGTTDDTAALQAILTFAQNHYNTPHTIYFPPGTYKITSTLLMNNVSAITFLGCGSNTIISWAGPTGGAMYAPNGAQNMRYVGFVWEGNNKAATAYESDPVSQYAGGIRIENNSFRDITAPATYTYFTDTNSDTGTTPTPPTAAITSGYWGGSYSGETQVWNCRFYNCTEGIAQTWNYTAGNFYCWFIDSCEFDNCPTGINLGFGGGNVVTNCHFQNSTTADILGGGNTHIRHCTSTGSAYFFSDPGSLGNPLDPNVVEDCWVDGWTNPGYAMYFQRAGPTTVFDCTFTNPPSGASSPIESTSVDIENHLILSNNAAVGLSAGTPLLNTAGQAALVNNVPPGLRFGALTLQSANQTFLNTAYPADATHIIDISQAPYVSQWTYPNQNGFGGIGLPDITTALQNAVNAARTANNGSVVYVPSGIYNLSATINASGTNYTIEGNGFSSEICWWGPDNSSMISITSPQNLAVKNIRLTVQNGETVAGVSASSTAATALSFDDISYGTFQVGNPGAGAALVDGPGLKLCNLPAGSTVYMPLLYIPLTVQNCGAAQILTRYLAGGGTLAVSGTTPQTGFLGAIFDEGGNFIANAYDITVTDNQDLILGDYYVEQDDSNLLLSRGAGTGVGRVTIGGFNTSSGNNAGGSGSQFLVNVNNYAGRLFYGSAGCNNWFQQYPVAINQTGTNQIDMIIAGLMPAGGFTFTLGSGANLIATQNVNQDPYPGVDIPDSPNPITAADELSMAQGLDHFRQLEAVDLALQDGITTDGPAIAQYPFEGNALDMTGNYNGTTSNVTYVPGLGAQAASFNGTNSYVQIPNPVSGSFSIAMWIQTEDIGGTGQWYQGKGLVDGYTAANAADFGTALNGGKFSFGVGSTDTTLTSTATVNDGNWHHLVATRNSATGAMQIYLDGALNNSMTGPAGIKSAAAHLRLGSLDTGASGAFLNGTIDQVQIFNYVLSATDVANIYNRTTALMPVRSPIPGVTATSTSANVEGNPGFTASNNSVVVGRSGILGASDSVGDSGFNPDASDFGNFVTNLAGANITYDLGANYEVNNLLIWNFSQEGYENAGANSVTILSSTNNVTFTTVGTYTFNQVTQHPGYGSPRYVAGALGQAGNNSPFAPAGTANVPDQVLPVSIPNARYIKLVVNSNWGYSGGLVGINQVNFVGSLSGSLITGVTATSTSANAEGNPGFTASNNSVVAGPSGILGADDSMGDSGFNPDASDFGNFVTNLAGANITYDLGANYVVNNLLIWNFSQEGFENAGAKSVTVLSSTNNVTFTTVGTYTFNQVTQHPGYGSPRYVAGASGQAGNSPFSPAGIANIPAQVLSVSIPNARYIKLVINSNWGFTGGLVGINEVNFMVTPNTYDLAADFDTTSDSASNPWCYGIYTTLGNPGTFQITGSTNVSTTLLSGMDFWLLTSGVDPNIEKNVTTSPIFAAGIDWLPGTVSFGPYTGPAVARFTAPVAGTYNIAAAFQTDQIRGSETSDGTTAYVYTGATNVFTHALSDPGAAQFGTVASYTGTNVALSAGETVDFVVGGGAFTTQVNATVTAVTP